jgi:hypothetical protein
LPFTSLFPGHCQHVTRPSLHVDDPSVPLRVPLLDTSGWGKSSSAMGTGDHFKESAAWQVSTFVAIPVNSVVASF